MEPQIRYCTTEDGVSIRGMARSSAGVEFEDRGEQEMKGVGEPVRVYAVRGEAT